MKDPIRIQLGSKWEWAHIPLSFVPSITLLGLAFGDPSSREVSLFLAIVYCSLPVVAVLSIPSLRYRVGKSIELNDEGIALGEHGVTVREIPWSQFGGYRLVPANADAFKESRKWTELLDRQGQLIVVVPITRHGPNHGNRQEAQRSAFYRALDRHVPEDGFPYEREVVVPKLPSWLKVAILTGVGTSASGLGFYLLSVFFAAARAEDLSPGPSTDFAFRCGYVGPFVLIAGLVCLLMGVHGVVYRSKPKMYEPRQVPDPVEGPTLRQFLLAHDGLPPMPSFQNGMRYRYVHPEASERDIQVELSIAKFLFWLLVFGPLIAPLAIWMNPQRSYSLSEVLIPPCICWVWSPVFYLWMRQAKYRIRSLQDTLWVLGDSIVAVSPDGTHRTVRLPRISERTRQNLSPVVNVGSWREPYYINTARLFEAPLDEDASPGSGQIRLKGGW